ncbi:MAG: hypothetical protein DRQ65_08240 [Gammaproteobacteria bacterium]|nr:MAG: hypothetical protein DRQ65_08240 [Gammaproteobacteria bacterium]
MITQNQIKRTLSTPANIEYIRQLLENEDIPHRTDLATRACKQFEFYDARGQIQISSCAFALQKMGLYSYWQPFPWLWIIPNY